MLFNKKQPPPQKTLDYFTILEILRITEKLDVRDVANLNYFLKSLHLDNTENTEYTSEKGLYTLQIINNRIHLIHNI